MRIYGHAVAAHLEVKMGPLALSDVPTASITSPFSTNSFLLTRIPDASDLQAARASGRRAYQT
jgi:hypothetical protein